MSIRGMWTPESGREPTDEELRAYSEMMAAEAAPADQPPVTAPQRAVEPGPATELPPTEIRAWSPESGREPTFAELQAYDERVSGPPPEPEEAPPPAPEEPEYGPRAEELRRSPGMADYFQLPSPYAMSGAAAGAIPVEEQPELVEDPVGQLIEPYQPIPRQPMNAVQVNPINLPPEDPPGRLQTAFGSYLQGAASILAGIPKSVQLWFAPDREIVDWMDEMDRLDAQYAENPTRENKLEQIDWRVRGMMDYGTVASPFTKRIFDLYMENEENTGEVLQANRNLARALFVQDLANTVDRPMYRAGEAFDQWVADLVETNPEYAEEFWSGQVPQGLGSATGFAATFLATRRLPGGKGTGSLATAGTGITVQQSFAFETALREGADIMTAFEAAFGWETTAAGASEAVPIYMLMARADRISGGQIKRALIRMLTQGTEEAIQEGVQGVLENMTAARLYDPERQLWTGDTTDQTAVGFTTGALLEALATLISPGRRRGVTGPEAEGGDLENQIEAARQEAAAAGGDPLDQTLAASRAAAVLAPEESARQAELAETLRARQEAREDRAEVDRPLAGLVEAEATIARLPFEQRAEAVIAGVTQAIAEDKQAAFAQAEAEAAQQRETEVQEAEFQREIQRGEEAAAVGEALEAAEAVQADVTTPTIGETLEPETRAGLERMQRARAERAEAPRAKAAPRPVAALPAPALRVTPEGEALLPEQAAEREAARAARPRGPVERPFAVEEDVEVAAETERATELTEQLDLPVGEVTESAQQAATSPTNQLPQPTEAQKEAGNYQKGRLGPNQVAIPGINVAIENPAGSVRSGTRDDGTRWTQDMRDHYGYINRTESAEGPTEQLDVFVNPEIQEQPYDTVFVIDQVNPDGTFDEHKVMMGYPNQMAAVRAYKRNYPRGQRVGPVNPMSKIEFRRWLETGSQRAPISDQLEAAPEVLAGEEDFRELVTRQRRGRGRRREREPVVRFRAEDQPVPTAGFFSRMREAVEQKMPAALPVDRVMQFIERQAQRGALRMEEAGFVQLEQALEGREGTITKQEILDLLDFRRPDIETQMLEDARARWFDTKEDALAHLADLYGPLQDMREGSGSVRDERGVLIAFLSKPEGANRWQVNYKMKNIAQPVYADYLAIPGGTRYREMLIMLPRKPGRFQSRFVHRHWDGYENVLAHVRMADFINDRGERTLVVLELQSDWHQIGRKQGYKSAEERLKREAAHDMPNATEQWLADVLGEAEETGMVEEAPFQKTWPLMAMRQVIDYAVANGYENVAWSTGEQQAELYGELNRVDELVYRPEINHLEIMSEGNFMEVEGGREEIEAVIGKEYTDQLMKAAEEREAIRNQYQIEEEFNEQEQGYLVVDPNGEYVRTFGGDLLVFDGTQTIDEIFLYNENLPGVDPVTIKGTSIVFGGEGMKTFYDKELVNTTNKWVKRYDSVVEDGRVAAGREYVPVHEFNITPEMQVGIATEGQPFFRAEEEVEGEKADRVQLRDAKKVVQPLTEQMKRIRPKILANPLQAPQELQDIMRERGAMQAKGVFYNGTLYIFAENHTEPTDVVRTLLHEGVAHMGLRAIYTNEGELDAFLDEVYASMTQQEIDAMRNKSRVYAAIDLDTPAGRRELAEEYVAELAETNPTNNFIQRLVAAVRQFLRYAGMELDYTNSDIVAVLADVRRELRDFVPLNRINVVSEVETETGEVIEIEERADIALRQVQKRQGVIESLRECIR